MKKIIKKSIFAICCVLLCLLGIGVIDAYLTTMDNTKNILSIGNNTIEIIENYEPPEKIIAGISFKKEIQVQNTGLSDCYVRLKVVFSDSDMEKFCSFLDLNTTDWTYNTEDNWYYYTKRLSNNEITSSLFTTISISDTIKDYQIKDFNIFAYAESFQASNYDNYEEAWEEYTKNKPTI